MKYKDLIGTWHNTKVVSCAGKAGGKHKPWRNVERENGSRRAVDFFKVDV